MSSNVQDIDALRRLHAAITNLSDDFEQCTTELRQIAHRFQEHVQGERKRYWQSQLQLGERALQSARQALARANIIKGNDGGCRSTEAELAVARSKRRVAYCYDKLARCKRLAAETDRVVDRFIGQLGAMSEMSESGLPHSAARLSAWIAALETYTDQSSSPQSSP